ncbi:MAG: methyltransferase domain-containing protein [Vicinamibacterales bacterium]|nr:methyltransferase domain-containing protein [Vicinamibacterales bacterium]
MARRSLEREYLDDHTPPQAVVDEVYWFLGAINRWLGGTRATLRRFEELSRGWTPGARIRVLDVASGGGDHARAIIRWGRAQGFDLHVTALDVSLSALHCAKRRSAPNDRLRFVCADVHQAPCRDGAFDYVICALFFHHLTDDEAVQMLRSFNRLATRGIVVNDLVRRWRHYAWSWLFTRPFNAVLRNDGPLSVRRAFRPDELMPLARRAAMTWLSIETHFGHRMTLAGDRPSPRGGQASSESRRPVSSGGGGP